jgi:hypothetical protein
MTFVTRLIKPIMIISGGLTLTMIYAALAPQAALTSMFGDTLTGPLAEIVVRNWGALIAIGGATLIWGALVPAVRSQVLIAVGVSKLVFIGLVLMFGRSYLAGQAGVAVGLDAVCVVLFALYLLESRRSAL